MPIPTLPLVSILTFVDKLAPLTLVLNSIAPSSLLVASVPAANSILATSVPFHRLLNFPSPCPALDLFEL